MSSTARLALGAEFELLLKPKPTFAARLENICPGWAARFEKAKRNTSRAEADTLREEFRKQAAIFLTKLTQIPTVTASPGYTKWSVVDEPALDEVPGYCKFSNLNNSLISIPFGV